MRLLGREVVDLCVVEQAAWNQILNPNWTRLKKNDPATVEEVASSIRYVFTDNLFDTFMSYWKRFPQSRERMEKRLEAMICVCTKKYLVINKATLGILKERLANPPKQYNIDEAEIARLREYSEQLKDCNGYYM